MRSLVMPTVDPLATPARIAFAGDWHANTAWAVAAVEHATERGAEVIVHLGDFGYDFRAEFVGGVDRALRKAGVPLLFVDGNHEDFPTLLRYPVHGNGLRRLTDHLWHLPRGLRWQWSGVRLMALGGAHSVDRLWRTAGVSWWREETITAGEAARATAGGPVDVLVCHDCPAGVDIPGLAESAHLWPPEELALADEHRTLLRSVVDAVRPSEIWHGHYHRRYRAAADLGHGPVLVQGLDCDGTNIEDNVVLVDLAELPPGPPER